ncbi:MAG: hypothetical protein KGM15_05665 [Pseudomonadota bacterium]|nr:hypothetical protein [Pseudomonadota bacterium]
MTFSLAQMREAAEAAGLALRGGFLLRDEERIGPLLRARTLLLLGFTGAEQWPVFAASPEAADGLAHPLDRWSRRVISALGARLGGEPLFPFDGPPYWPFQAWARRAEPVFPSPLGLLIHPRFGLWHNYRGALAFAEPLDLPARPEAASPCANCAQKPCLSTCPVGAFSPAGFDPDACAGFMRAGGACREEGCAARRACPVGREYAHAPAQSLFYMRAFLAARA